MDMKLVKLADIKSSAHNARKTFDEVKMKELIASVKEKGILNPILIRPLKEVSGSANGKDLETPIKGKYELVCGERRLRAASAVGLVEIPAVIRTLTDQQALECMIVENLQREDVHPLEEAEGYEALMKKHGYKDVKDIAAKVGKSTAYIYGRLKLCDLIPENRKYFYEGKFSPSVALLVARVPKELQKEAGKEVVTQEENYGDGPMTYAEAKDYIEGNFMLQMKEASWDPKEKGLANKGSCLECPKRTHSQKELFADIQGADRCTDPGCFNAKKQAFNQRKIAELKKQGKKLLDPDQAKSAMSYGSNYIKLGDTCYQAGTHNKRPTYGELAKKAKDADIVYALDPDSGKLIDLITKPEAARILKKLGVKDESSETKTRGEKVAEHKQENRVDTERTVFFVGKISQNLDQRVKNVLTLSALLNRLTNGCGAPDDEVMDKYLDGVLDDDYEAIYNLGDKVVKELIERALQLMPAEITDIEQLDFLAAKLGFTLAKDYVITKEYLEACTKEELIKLIKELGISFAQEGTAKKDLLVEYIFKHAPKGKVPKELVK